MLQEALLASEVTEATKAAHKVPLPSVQVQGGQGPGPTAAAGEVLKRCHRYGKHFPATILRQVSYTCAISQRAYIGIRQARLGSQ